MADGLSELTRDLPQDVASVLADDARRDFLTDPRGVATRAGLAPMEVDGLAAIDRVGLELAARGFEKKRAAQAPRRAGWRRRLIAVGRYLSSQVPIGR
jgi:hypothetical protein